MNSKRTNKFELLIEELTKPLDGQYPRPWMTDLKDPMSADVFIVGANQAMTYDVLRLTHKRHLDALFNRNGESCRSLYDEMTNHRSSHTRKNIDGLRKVLERQGVCNVLETNVICYSTPMSEDLKRPGNKGGAARGTEIFENLLRYIRPRVMIVHGAGAAKELGRVLGSLPDVPKDPGQVVFTRDAERTIFVIPSLAPPEWNKWHKWAEPYQAKIAKAVAKELATPNDAPEMDAERNIEVKKYDAALRTLRGKRFISVQQTGKSERWLLNLRVNEAFELAQDLLTMVDWYHKVTIGCLKDNRDPRLPDKK